MPITSKILNNWNKIHSYQKPGWVFRGQKCEKWLLETSLGRLCKRERIKGENIKPEDLEKNLLRDFKRTYHLYARHIPEQNPIVGDSTIEWISLMQHHGAPTRLLDFTYSIYVAAYFGLEKADFNAHPNGSCAIWAVNGVWAMEQSIKHLLDYKNKEEAARRLPEPTQALHEKDYDNIFFEEPPVKLAFSLNPFRLNQRLRTQNGVFVVPGTVNDSFMDNLSTLDGYEKSDNLIKIEIPYTMREKAIEHLFYMNISRTSLFPGLDGYANSLCIFHPSFRPDNDKGFKRLRSIFGKQESRPPSP